VKTLLKNLLVPALASRPVNTIADLLFTAGIPVFMLHRFESSGDGVSGHDPLHLERCLQYLVKHGYNFVSVEQIISSIKNEQSLPKRPIAFTMDDGFLDQATIAAPIFIKYQCPVTIFLISGMLDHELWPWDDQAAYLVKNTEQPSITLSLAGQEKSFDLNNTQQQRATITEIQNWVKTLDANLVESYLNALSNATAVTLPVEAPVNYRAMSWEQARELEKQGVLFSPHTKSHRILSKLDDTHSEFEITHSWKRLTEELDSPSPVFCYPTGRTEDFSQREIDHIKHQGLIGAVSTEATFVSPKNRQANYLFKLPRFGFPNSFTDFLQYCSWIERAKTQILNR
jgi:peptidoglycan/xylan/chitin deacetylase (PgdA/CDA1 family)